MYKPRTIAQFKVMEYLKSSFVMEDCLVSPISLNGLMLEDRTMERIAFICYDDRIWESTIPAPAGRNSVRIFAHRLCLAYPRPEQQIFEAKTTLWLDHPGLLTYQQALGLPDDLFRHYLRYGVPTEDEVGQLAAQGRVSDEEY